MAGDGIYPACPWGLILSALFVEIILERGELNGCCRCNENG